MEILEIFGLQFLLSLTAVGLFAYLQLRPWLKTSALSDALFWLTLPHAFRHLGLTFLVPDVVGPAMPESFSIAAAYGDMTAGLLAMIMLVASRRRWALMIPIAWLFNVVGVLDLANALSHAEAIPYFQSTWFIPTFVVPVLLVTHFMMAARLFGSLRDKMAAVPSRP